MSNPIFVTIKLDNLCKIIKVSKRVASIMEDLTYEDYVLSALEAVNMPQDDFSCFLNQHGARIEPDIFTENITNQLYCSCFMLEMERKTFISLDSGSGIADQELGTLKRMNAEIGYNVIVTSDYIIRKAGGSSLLADYNIKQILTDYQRRKVISFLAAFAQETFGFRPTKEQQASLAYACVTLFPCLKSNSENELELLCNGESTGYLQTKLKNDRVKKRKLEKQFDDTYQEPQTEHVDNDWYNANDLICLKQAALPEEIELVKTKLKSTVSFRREEVKNPEYKIYEECRYYFLCPTLITYDFDLTFKTCTSIITEWPNFQNHIFTVIRNSGKSILYTETQRDQDWDFCTFSILNLLRLLPPSPAGRKKIQRVTDEQAVDKLIIFQNDGLTNQEYLEESHGRAPYIVATGDLKDKIKQYLIVLDSNIIPLSSSTTILQAIDYIFKLHFLFNIEYDNNLRLFWCFIEKYIYKLSVQQIPTTVKDLYLKLIKEA